MMMKIGQRIGCVNLMCLVVDVTSNSMSIKRPHGSKVASNQWRPDNFGKP
jgi:hypothetical protein